MLERALILAGEAPIGPEHLTLGVAPRSRNVVSELLVPGFDLDGFERELLHAALERAGGNKSAAARLLGITRRRFYSRLDSLAAATGRRQRGLISRRASPGAWAQGAETAAQPGSAGAAEQLVLPPLRADAPSAGRRR